MAKTRKQKEEELKDLIEKLKKNKSVVFCDYTGLDVASVEELRKSLRAEEVDYKVAKKTLLTKALKKAGILGIEVKELKGQLSVAFGYKDEVAPAKLISKFRKSHEQMTFLGGIYENKFIGIEEVERLAAIPSREELLAKVVGSISAPISGTVRVLSGVLRNFVGALRAIKDVKS